MDPLTLASISESSRTNKDLNNNTDKLEPFYNLSQGDMKEHAQSKKAAKGKWAKIKNLIAAGKKSKKEIYVEHGIGIEDEKEMDSFFGSDQWRTKKSAALEADDY
ncbi:hypothetical protein FPQ18DRAFT_308511 [Pyronema domesticum]|uniref:Uncharacterized protein n=1 Tax=Pyronema omphalodes (strain CBS 100304) TaxID=1076935 RepID=U4KU37_PYROM|nr:hypothetical protein FPQ18DRAFT_308511 [Pyronema domesticum]CCX04723.1 Protein of unknown function [Pyronema omphalodes CBS 100304]